ncbi:Receptor-type tyrosine-protein phosphatase gamma [Fukomys damarensis]|uniref:Receptor-type tyrosine-protein phosphatase gamma n=1 Tax=Fukomys damarensis TaxID=885580 RepID=A0A091D2M4_FUKDA|nr:Receptor-type tyrosine-protein phosphatase gamma [Fukomys damarensis]
MDLVCVALCCSPPPILVQLGALRAQARQYPPPETGPMVAASFQEERSFSWCPRDCETFTVTNDLLVLLPVSSRSPFPFGSVRSSPLPAPSGKVPDLTGAYGPEHWVTSSVSCGGHHQSPIDIPDHLARVGEEYQELQLDGFDSESSNKTWMKNTGKTVAILLKDDYFISGAGLPGRFKAEKVEFHWGHSNGSAGSEHSINGRRFPVERNRFGCTEAGDAASISSARNCLVPDVTEAAVVPEKAVRSLALSLPFISGHHLKPRVMLRTCFVGGRSSCLSLLQRKCRLPSVQQSFGTCVA